MTNDNARVTDMDLVGWFLDLIEKKGLSDPEAGDLVEVSHTTIGRWKAGHGAQGGWKTLRAATRRRLEGLFADPPNSQTPGGVMVNEIEASLEREWWAEYKRIQSSDSPPDRKVLEIDQLASLIARIAWAIGEDAARTRARAVIEERSKNPNRTPSVDPAPVEPPDSKGDSTGRGGGASLDQASDRRVGDVEERFDVRLSLCHVFAG